MKDKVFKILKEKKSLSFKEIATIIKGTKSDARDIGEELAREMSTVISFDDGIKYISVVDRRSSKNIPTSEDTIKDTEIENISGSNILKCPKCKREYVIGENAGIVTVYGAMQAFAQSGIVINMTQNGQATRLLAPKHNPALVGYPEGDPKDQRKTIKESVATAEAIRALIKAGHPQYWYCRECNNYKQPYRFPWGDEMRCEKCGRDDFSVQEYSFFYGRTTECDQDVKDRGDYWEVTTTTHYEVLGSDSAWLCRRCRWWGKYVGEVFIPLVLGVVGLVACSFIIFEPGFFDDFGLFELFPLGGFIIFLFWVLGVIVYNLCTNGLTCLAEELAISLRCNELNQKFEAYGPLTFWNHYEFKKLKIDRS